MVAFAGGKHRDRAFVVRVGVMNLLVQTRSSGKADRHQKGGDQQTTDETKSH